MDTRNRAPVFITLFALLAVLYPVLGIRTSAKNPAISTKTLTGTSETPEGEPAKQEFPGAKDLVARFLFSHAYDQANPAGKAAHEQCSIEFLIATVPDPVDSRLPNFFDSFAESIESAAGAAGYALDRFALPWITEGDSGQEKPPLWRPTLYDSVPGLILFRDPTGRKLLLVLLVGETPTTGIHKQAMFSALDQIAQFYPWDPHHADLPPMFPEARRSGPTDTFRILGPSFSGSMVSLRFALEGWLASRSNSSNLRFQIISGTATAIDTRWLSHVGHDQATFRATVPPDDETFPAFVCYLQWYVQSGSNRIAVLREENTGYGQTVPGGFVHGSCGGTVFPDILSLPFPLHISRLREASVQATNTQPQPGSGPGSSKSASAPRTEQRTTEPREVLPSFSDLTVQSAELTLSNLLSTIAREQYTYVGIVATDVRDTMFLAREVRQHCPATVLFTVNSDLLYAGPTVNDVTQGMLVFTPYPLFNLEQLWTYPYRGGETRLQFSSQAAEGVYNATLALLNRGELMVDYGPVLPTPDRTPQPELRKPSLWVTAIGNGETLPVKLLPWQDLRGYTYSPAQAVETSNKQVIGARKYNLERGLYSRSTVVAVIVVNLLLSAFSLLIISQYRRMESKKRANRVSALLGDTVSPAYWSEGRLFLLCCCWSLLTFYIVAAVDLCLPFIAGIKLGQSARTTLTSTVALFLLLSAVTMFLLLIGIRALFAAFRAAPAVQRGSAPEVLLFVLLACVGVFIPAGLLCCSWFYTLKLNWANGLLIFFRSFDLRSGLSPLVPLSCVAAGACLWALCSFRRLRLIDILRASGTAEEAGSWLSFLSLEGRSFTGVRELEGNIKDNLERSTVISRWWYVALMTAAWIVWVDFFYFRLVRELEGRPFYWLFGAAFFIVYWALLMEFMRLVFVWRGLHLLLQRLAWHPLLTAFKRYQGRFPNFTKIDLTHRPSRFAALEASVEQAGRLLRTAKTLTQAPRTDPGLRELLRQSIPEWETHAQAAEALLSEALRLQWTDPSQADDHAMRETIRTKHAIRLKGDWRQALELRHRAHRSLFELMQSLDKPMEQYWDSDRAGHSTPAAALFFRQVEEFFVTRLVNFLALVFPSLQNLGYFVLVGLLLMLLAVTSYPFQPRNEFLFFNWVVILSFIGTLFWIFVEMDRNTVLSFLNGTKPGQVHFSLELVLRTVLYLGVPLLALLGAQFPQSVGKIISVFTAAQGSP
jgi:hypothetical protein